MKSLQSVKFKDFIQLQRGFDLPKYDIVTGPYPVIGSTSVIGYHNQFKVEPPGVITGRSGSLGQLQFIREKYWPHNTSLWVRDFKGNYPRYVYYFLKSLDLSNFNSGAGVPTLNRNHLDTMELFIHPLSDQYRIAAILSAYDDLIENNSQRIKLLEKMAQAIYREWFINFRFPGYECVQMVESEQGPVPDGWEIRKLGDIAEEVRRNVEPNMVHSDTPYFGLEHIPRKSIALSEWGFAKDVQSTKHQFIKGEILFGKIRPYFHKVGVAPVDGVCSSDAIVIRPKKSEYFGLVLFCVSSEDFVSQATQTSQGTKMPRANWNVLVNYPVVIPPKALLDEFNNIASDMVDLIITKIFQNANLRRTRDLLLPKLISGELDVSELDIRIPEAEA